MGVLQALLYRDSEASGARPLSNGGGGGSVRSDWPDNDDRYYGLVNVGNICYCSSVLQSLYFCRAFRDCVNNYPHPRQLPGGSRVVAFGRRTDVLVDATHLLERSASTLEIATRGSEHGLALPATPDAAGVSLETTHAKGKTLSAFRERASGFRRKKGRGGSGDAIPGIGDTAANASEDKSKRALPGAAGNYEGNYQARIPTDAARAPANASANTATTADGSAEPTTQAQQLRPAVDGQAEDVSSAAKFGIGSSMFSELKDLFWLISTRGQRTGSLSPQGFIAKLKQSNELFRSNAHQDSHEFLNYLLNEIVENVERINRDRGPEGCTGAPLQGPNHLQGKTWVHTLFEGLLTNETRCLSCECVTSRDETILDVSVDIHENTSVANCLNQFAAGELLCHDNKFYCDNCGGLQEAERRMRLKRLPNILALHLKRFKYHEVLGRYVKLSYRVNFPTELRVPNTTEETEDVLYSLSAVVVHLGGGPFHGHYISIVRSGDKWVLFDDDCVEIIKESELSNYFGDFPNFGSGYVLLYERTDFDPMQYDLPRPFAAPGPDPPLVSVPGLGGDSGTVASDLQANSLHLSLTMPNLVKAAGPATMPPAPAVVAADGLSDAGSGSFRFAAPMRPPPLISTSRSVHGNADPGPLSSGPRTPNNLTPSLSTVQPASFHPPGFPSKSGAPSSSIPSVAMFSQTPSQPIARAAVDVDSAAMANATSGNIASGNVASSSTGKGRSWFGRRSKK
ncbi:hypothetical protein GGI04_001456 [Coemansia thaxteri]|uniref:Ubiquitin carboxyl-terminal hydrolase n=1 Tax=Coemansia thaxteri TaxID=2663907 RepID=A0A9W8BJV8_9FUNG|nr:hypothetical protein H4R26_002881 [Coemansia thaxteri]KAJ2007623.1 hypothetical protein GGI04_001456 [Coemansia thaxteri]KAJ2472700.1 hypothetical protein GGI02_001393 [Coemansia sp. RSA 2322]KAJ2483150.1 hypothetical protein EV174_003020 [Coemansia sp. RSA 2320]